MSKLSDSAIEDGIGGSGWRREGGVIVCDRHLKDFAEAIAFVNRVAQAAEVANHHPDILVHGYNRVRIELSTHSEGGITESDLQLAKVIDGLL